MLTTITLTVTISLAGQRTRRRRHSFPVCSVSCFLTPASPSTPPPPSPTVSAPSASPPSLCSFLSSLSQQVWPREQVGSATGVLLSPWQPPPTLPFPLLPPAHSLKHMRVGKHAHGYSDLHTSHVIQPLALVGLVCATQPCEWYLESPCPAPISVPPSRGADVFRARCGRHGQGTPLARAEAVSSS